MTRARRTLALTAIAALTFTVAACSKPAPGVSVFSGTNTVRQEALCWAFDADQLDPTACAQDVITGAVSGGQAPSLTVVPGDVIGISVDPAVAEAGWTPAIGGQKLTTTPITSTYYRFTYPDLQEVPADGLSLQIIAGKDTSTRGIWVFALNPA
jgi:hypothetical protein